ncbi:MAG: hypothetical protein ACI9RU_001129 [Litorivivens sp.]|jgi:hypothetical protein
MKNNIPAVVFSIAIVLAAFVLGNAFMNRNAREGSISVTGLGKTDFTSDLIVWTASFSKVNFDLKEAYSDLEKDKALVAEYLENKGIERSKFVFGSVNTQKNTQAVYSDEGRYLYEEFTGYTLDQSVEVKSKKVEKVENVSREITELLHQGVQVYSNNPRYYYTQLEDLKVEMISRATENAFLRASKIAENSGAQLSELTVANMGIFQITGQHSVEDYSWGGAFNTTSKEKTASITMKLTYKVK